MKNKENFTKGKIYLPLVKFAIPILFATLLQIMYGAVDLLIVGWFGNSADVSAVSTGSQIMQMITSFVIGLSMGTTVLLGRKIGASKSDEAGDVVGTSVVLFAFIGIIITVLTIVFVHPITSIINAPEEAYTQTIEYIVICGIGFVFITAYNVICAIFRGIGDSKTPLLVVFFACILNILGDLLFVGVFHMNTMGVAIATVIAQASSVFISLFIIKKRGLPFIFERNNIKLKKEYAVQIVKIGLPIAMQDVLNNLSFIYLGSLTNSFGVIASAGVGVARRLAGMIMLVPIAFANALSVFVAQNMGANDIKRANLGFKYAIITSVSVGVCISYFTVFHGQILSGVFTSDPLVTAASAEYLRSYGIDVLLTSFTFCLIGYFNGHGKTLFVMCQALSATFLVRIPVSYLMSILENPTLFKLGLAIPISSVFQFTIMFIYFTILNKKIKQKSLKN